MLRYAILFFILALAAGALGFSGIAASFGWIAQLLAVLFVALMVVSVIVDAVGSASAGKLV